MTRPRGAVHRLGGVGRLIPNPHLLIGPPLRLEAEHLFSTPILTAASAESLPGVTRPTAHSAIDALVERGDLHEITGRERGRIYEAPGIFEAVHGPVDIGEPCRTRNSR